MKNGIVYAGVVTMAAAAIYFTFDGYSYLAPIALIGVLVLGYKIIRRGK